MTSTLRLLGEDTSGERPALVERYRDRLFLKVAEVAELTDTDPRTVRRAIDDGQIVGRHIGSSIRVPAAPFWLLCGLDPVTLRPPHGDQQVEPDPNDDTPASGARHAPGTAAVAG